MLARYVADRLLAALADRPVVLLHGARQVGKTTLARALAAGDHPARYVSLDLLASLAAAREDPEGFLAGFDGPVVLDEVQRAPDLLLAVKAEVDRDRRPGRFLLTGSANVLFLPRVAETLAGRMEIVTLWPLSQGEIEGRREGFVDAAFSPHKPVLNPPAPTEVGPSLHARLLRGGFPEVGTLRSANRRRAWFDAYLTTILSRDVRDLARIERLTELPGLLALLAARPMALLNYAELARSAGLAQSTLKRYLALLEGIFLVRTVRPWKRNLGKRLVKRPKILLADSGLAAYLLGIDAARLARDPSLAGGLLEAFVAMEITKQTAWSKTAPALYHFRTHADQEVDLVLERRSGEVVGIEVKASSKVGGADLKGLRALADLAGPRFHRGIVLYTGTEVVPFGPRLHALPINALWRLGRSAEAG